MQNLIALQLDALEPRCRIFRPVLRVPVNLGVRRTRGAIVCNGRPRIPAQMDSARSLAVQPLPPWHALISRASLHAHGRARARVRAGGRGAIVRRRHSCRAGARPGPGADTPRTSARRRSRHVPPRTLAVAMHVASAAALRFAMKAAYELRDRISIARVRREASGERVHRENARVRGK